MHFPKHCDGVQAARWYNFQAEKAERARQGKVAPDADVESVPFDFRDEAGNLKPSFAKRTQRAANAREKLEDEGKPFSCGGALGKLPQTQQTSRGP